jgi:hypothetical protein
MLRFIGVLLLFCVATTVCHQRTVSRRDRFPAEEDILYLPKVSALKAISLGHQELAATLVFIRALVYFGGELGTKEKRFTWMDNYLDTIVTLDPQFEMAYRWAGSAIMYNGRTITNEAVERANYFLKRGVEHFPHSWQLPWMIGCNYLFEMHTDDPKQKAEWTRMGADWIRQAALVGSAPPWASLLAAQIMRKEGQTEAALRYLEEVYLTTNEERTRQEIRTRIMLLRSKADAEGLEQRSKSFIDAWQANFPYAHPDLFVIMGPPPSPRLDLEWLGRNEVLLAAERAEKDQQAPPPP